MSLHGLLVTTWCKQKWGEVGFRYNIAYLVATFSVNPGILIIISLYASVHHLYTTLATGEWMISWLDENISNDVRSTECSCHLVSSHPYNDNQHSANLPVSTMLCAKRTPHRPFTWETLSWGAFTIDWWCHQWANLPKIMLAVVVLELCQEHPSQ